MKRIFAIIALLAVTSAGFAQNAVSTNLGEFNKIELTGRLNVEIVQSDDVSLDVKLNDVDAKKLEWGIKNGVLSVRLKPGGGSSANADVRISYKNLAGLKVSGANVAVKSTVRAPLMDVSVSGGATLKMDVEVEDLKVNASGNSVLDLAGSTKYFNVKANTKAMVDSRRMKAEDATVQAATTADVYVFSSERIDINATTAASVFYKGNPDIVRQKSTLGGNIHSLGE